MNKIYRQFFDEDLQKLTDETVNEFSAVPYSRGLRIFSTSDNSLEPVAKFFPEAELIEVLGKPDQNNLIVKYLMNNSMLTGKEYTDLLEGEELEQTEIASSFVEFWRSQDDTEMVVFLYELDDDHLDSIVQNAFRIADGDDSEVVYRRFKDQDDLLRRIKKHDNFEYHNGGRIEPHDSLADIFKRGGNMKKDVKSLVKVRDLLGTKNYETFVSKLGKMANDKKVLALLTSGLLDGKKSDEKFSMEIKDIPVKNLIPTQNEIDMKQSLDVSLKSVYPDSLEAIIEGNSVEIMSPLVILNDKYILDGHHRWSQIYATNKNATVKSLVFKGDIKPIDMLKVLQIAIASDINDVPTKTTKGINMLKVSKAEIEKAVSENISLDTIAALYAGGKIRLKTKRAATQYFVDNVMEMQKTSQPITGAPSRNVMPQTDESKTAGDLVRSGKVNFKPPYSRIMKTGGQVSSSLVKRIAQANEYIQFAIDNDIWGETDFGSTMAHLIEFTKPIRVKNQFVYVEYKETVIGGRKLNKERYNLNNSWSEEDLRWEISHLIKAVKKGAKEAGHEVTKFGIGGVVFTALLGAYAGYRVGRSQPQKKGFTTEKAVFNEAKLMLKERKERREAKKPAPSSILKTGGQAGKNKIHRPVKVRFHLARGENYMKWKIENKDTKEILYLSPDEVQLTMINCLLTNRPATANKIYTGAMNKAPIAWIECTEIEISSDIKDVVGSDRISYNPRTAPNWQNTAGDNVDKQVYPKLITYGRSVFYEQDGKLFELGGELGSEFSFKTGGEVSAEETWIKKYELMVKLRNQYKNWYDEATNQKDRKQRFEYYSEFRDKAAEVKAILKVKFGKIMKTGGTVLTPDELSDFNEWKNDGNVSKNKDGTYSTQDAQWKNKIKNLNSLKEYFKREFRRYKTGGDVQSPAEAKFIYVMREFGKGNLKHGSTGNKVTERDMAVAIAYSEAHQIDPEFTNKKSKGGSTYAEGGKIHYNVFADFGEDNGTMTIASFDTLKEAEAYKEKVEKKEAKDLGDEWLGTIDDIDSVHIEKTNPSYAEGGEIKTWKEGDKVMALMRGTKARGYQNAIITGIDKENGILTETDNPETLLGVYSKEEKLSDEIFAREIKSFPSSATKKEAKEKESTSKTIYTWKNTGGGTTIALIYPEKAGKSIVRITIKESDPKTKREVVTFTKDYVVLKSALKTMKAKIRKQRPTKKTF